MDMNQDLQNKLKNMDSASLKQAAEQATRIFGTENKALNEILGSPDKLSKLLSQLKPQDLARIQAAIKNPEKLDSILKEKTTGN